MRSSSLDRHQPALAAPVLFVALALLVSPAPASALNPEFEGDWEVDVENSEGIPDLLSASRTITYEDNQIHIVAKSNRKRAGENDFEVTFITNGELHNKGEFYPQGVQVEWKGWGGKRLEIKWKFKAQGGFVIKAKETWKSQDANLLLERVFTPPMGGEFKQKLIFVRPKK